MKSIIDLLELYVMTSIYYIEKYAPYLIWALIINIIIKLGRYYG